MNATPFNPVIPAKPPSSPAKAQDASAPDVPFSQVLSSEIAHSRKGGEQSDGTDARAAAATASDPAASSAPHAAAAAKAKEDAKAGRDPQQGDAAPTPPEVLLGLPIAPALLPRAAAGAAQEAAGVPRERAAPVAQGAADGHRRLPAGLASPQPTRDTATAQPGDPAHAGKTDFHAAVMAAAASASGHAADKTGAEAVAAAAAHEASRRSEFAKASELPSVLAASPALQTTPHLAAVMQDANPPGRLAPSVGSTAWNQALGERIVWMATGDQQTASLTLNPPDLGPLQVVLNVSNEQATASFFSAQPEVRHALESALPRLREMMNEAGIQLGQATVSADTPNQHDTPERQAQWAPAPLAATERGAAAIPDAAHAPVRQSGRGLVDTFA